MNDFATPGWGNCSREYVRQYEDTVGAMAGAVGGARFGAGDASERWLAELAGAEELRELGAQLATDGFGVGAGR